MFKFLLKFFLISVVLVGGTSYYLGSKFLDSNIPKNKKGTAGNLYYEVSGLEVSPLGSADIEKLYLLFSSTKGSFPLKLANASGGLSLLKLLTLSLSLPYRADLYQGSLDGSINVSALSDSVNFDLDLKDVNLDLHPYISDFGIGGIISLSSDINYNYKDLIKRIQSNNKDLFKYFESYDGEIDLYLKDGRASVDYLYRELNKFGISLPYIKDINLDLESQINKGIIDIKKGVLNCSLGMLETESGRYNLTTVKPDYNFLFKLNLTESGAKFLNQYLSLIAKGANPDTRNWKISARSLDNPIIPVDIKAEALD